MKFFPIASLFNAGLLSGFLTGPAAFPIVHLGRPGKGRAQRRSGPTRIKPSRYDPHQGEQEKARRRRQMQSRFPSTSIDRT